MYKIDKNVPIPPKAQNGGRKSSYPFQEMQVTDSIFVSGKESGKRAVRAALDYNRRVGSKFVTRAEGDGVRIWRVK